eukprot:3471401-Amphidinium_carterae.2
MEAIPCVPTSSVPSHVQLRRRALVHLILKHTSSAPPFNSHSLPWSLKLMKHTTLHFCTFLGIVLASSCGVLEECDVTLPVFEANLGAYRVACD